MNPGDIRQWEAPTAGVVFDLQGPDAQAVTMDPAPALLDGSGTPNRELVLEMAEVYELAILRDEPLVNFQSSTGSPALTSSLSHLNPLNYIVNQSGHPGRVNSSTGLLDAQTVFRGSSPELEVGPYLSQLMLIGNTDRNGVGTIDEGLITYGVLQIDQKDPIVEPSVNFIVTMGSYVDVPRGVKPPPEP